jgi:c-di-GMP-related signal transduction protein
MVPPKVEVDGQDIFLGRQSILDREQNLHAFELLFRSGSRNFADVSNATAATATVINYALNELGMDSLLGNYRGFINLDTEMLLSETIELLPREKVVLEILETVAPTPDIVDRCRFLRSSGFTLAMDDFVRYDAALLPLLDLTHIVKVDLQQLDRDALTETADRLRRFNVQMLAEKVDNVEQFKICLDLGFHLFQGYYFAKPQIITGKRLSSSEMVVMRLLGMLLADADSAEIEKAFKQDPGLSVNMMRLVNSVGSGAGGKVRSLSSALMVLGRRQVQRWLQLLLFAQLSPSREFPSPLLQLAAARGKFMELMAAGDKSFEDSAFMAGIMSLMDALLGMPLAEIINGLPVADEVRDALLERKGRLGSMLVLAEAVENHDAAALSAALDALPGIAAAQVNSAQSQALRWANSLAQPG